MACNHMWGEPPVSQCFTEEWPKLGKTQICNICKAILINGIKVGRVVYRPSEKSGGTLLAIDQYGNTADTIEDHLYKLTKE